MEQSADKLCKIQKRGKNEPNTTTTFKLHSAVQVTKYICTSNGDYEATELIPCES